MPRYRKIGPPNRASGGFTQPRHQGRMSRKVSTEMPRPFRKGRRR